MRERSGRAGVGGGRVGSRTAWLTVFNVALPGQVGKGILRRLMLCGVSQMTTEAQESNELVRKIALRRTFAIIAHPDAGKTTLTEKLLLYGGAIHLAGAVKAKRGRAA